LTSRESVEPGTEVYVASKREEANAMYVRVVRFSDVSAERFEGTLARIKESDGPPPDVPSTALRVLFDEAQGTAVVLQYFATAEDMEAGAKVLDAMDVTETPGVRESVDTCELKLELEA
jgi:molybdopterin/thiamine biosynthesis adenylyltransferase